MCLSCGRLWTALQILWSTLYVICGAVQLMAGIFFTISVPELQLYCILVAGSWNIIIGICGGMVACIGVLSPRRQETLLYLAVSVLSIACVNVILTEYRIYKTDMPKLLKSYSNHMLIDYACFVTRIATAVVLLVSFVDSQFTFCSMQAVPKKRNKKLRGSHEQVSDIEYIIPRPKNSKPHTHTVYNAYAQSWVFDAENPGSSHATSEDGPYFKVLQNGTPKKSGKSSHKKLQSLLVTENGGHSIDNPVVQIEEASDDSTSNSDRKLCYMKSFSRSQSPVVSASSSQISLNLNQSSNPPIYEYLEKLTEPTLYRSRLNTALSNKEEEELHYQAPQSVIMRRVEPTSPQVEKVQYASLMKELQKAIVSKKEPPSVTSPQSTASDSAPTSEKTQTSKSSSRSEGKSSDADFSKELEAALQLIQDLESPNTIETPSEAKSAEGQARPLAVWRNSDASESSEKTLSAVGSIAEITSPLTECQPELYTLKPSVNGKGASVVVHYPDSQSTSGYSSPTHGPTPNWSTTSSINGSNPEIKPTSYSIHNTKSTTVISLFSSPNNTKGKSVTLVKITGDNEISHSIDATQVTVNPIIHNSKFVTDYDVPKNTTKTITDIDLKEKLSPIRVVPPTGWKLNSLLRKKKQNVPPKLAPELEGAIIKSESLAYLSDLELLARHQRNKDLQREIEKRVVQQLGAPRATRTESNC
ncbi:uncharacterized protein [Leptinotarsa decemlineata]|uniref:uncharacterized protein n=1 Tax=Leptinotarsa decemlineata TaxID=7539 RepID=UPI003D309304